MHHTPYILKIQVHVHKHLHTYNTNQAHDCTHSSSPRLHLKGDVIQSITVKEVKASETVVECRDLFKVVWTVLYHASGGGEGGEGGKWQDVELQPSMK